MVEQGRKSGHIFPQPDLIIAATGQHQRQMILPAHGRNLVPGT